MAIPVPVSHTPLAFDALPALKVRHYYGRASGGNIYTLARLYIFKDALALSLAAFEREPDDASRVGFALCGEGAPPLRLALSPKGARLFLEEAGELPAPGAAPTGGSDEQGWYWGANLTLPAATLARAGLHLQPGRQFYAGLYKTREGEDALGSAFPLPDLQHIYSPAGFGLFEAIAF